MNSTLIQSYKEERRDIFNKRLGVIFNGEDNLRPLIVENIIESSPTASQCASIYSTFLGGGGFEVDLSNVNLNENPHDPVNPNDLLFDTCEVISNHQAVFIQVGYNANFEKDSFQVLPYSLCRLGQKDSDNYSGKILVSRLGWGKYLKKDNIDVFDVYNPRPEVIAAQVEAAGGWENYKGQVLYFRLSKKFTYGRSLIETAYSFADTEHQIGLYFLSTTRRGFEDITYIRHREFPSEAAKEEFYDNVKALSGIDNASSKLVIQDNWDDEGKGPGNFKFDVIPNNVKADKFSHFQTSAANYIRKVFKNIPSQLVDYISGKLGNTTGEDLIKAQSIYNASISKDQEKIEMLFKELFTNYKYNINPSNNWTIKQYSLLKDGTVDYNTLQVSQPVNKSQEELDRDAIRQAQATLRGSVGGVSAILSIQASVAAKTTTLESGVAMLINIFGYSEEVARTILGNPEQKTSGNGTTN